MTRPLLVQLVDPRADRLVHGVGFALAAAAVGRPVVIAFFMGALDVLVRGGLLDLPLDGLPADVASRLADGLERHPPQLSRLLVEGRALGVRVYACSGSVELLGLTPAEVLPHVDDVVGLPTILRRAGEDAVMMVV
jgi:predicted peroxiredoxin